jgi:23S rRNA (pseudouridine1915-N3)-methyltransferase
MKIFFRLAWAKGAVTHKHFKSKECHALAAEYASRISHFAPCELASLEAGRAKPAGSVLWLCDTSKQAKALSSDELASHLQRLENSGVREWNIAIGGADGFDAEAKRELGPDLLWNFGPLTLPHELAAVVAAEQVYRAYTILKGLPYHSGH